MSGGSDNSDEIEEANQKQQELLQQQIDTTNREIEEKKQAVFNERLNIINSQRGQQWGAGKSTPAIQPQFAKPIVPGKPARADLSNNPLKPRSNT